MLCGHDTKHLAKLGEDLNKPKNILFVLIHFLAYLVPILLQGDIGTALYLHRNICRSCICGGNILQIHLSARFGVAGITPLLWNMMKDYQKLRILFTAFSLNSTRLKKAISRLFRGWLSARVNFGGLGYRKGIRAQNSASSRNQNRLHICHCREEWGFMGCVFVLLVLVTIVLLIFRNARKAKDQKGFFICIAVASTIMFQTLINIGMCIGFLPVIGVTLPFFSYGGSSVLCPFDFSRSCSGSLREARPFAQIRNEVNAENFLKLLDFSVDLIYRTLITKGAVFFRMPRLILLFRLLTVVFRYSLRCRSFCHILFQPLQDTSHQLYKNSTARVRDTPCDLQNFLVSIYLSQPSPLLFSPQFLRRE